MKLMSAAVLAGALALAGAQDEKRELRAKFQKGEKFQIHLKNAVHVKVDEIPEAYQGFLGDDPINIKIDGVLAVEVTEVAEDGKATLAGAWKSLNVKGGWMVSEVDFKYESEKKGEKSKKKEEDPALLPFGDIEDMLATAARQPVKAVVDRFGKLTVLGDKREQGTMATQFLSLNGLLGPLPAAAVKKGDAWKNEERLSMPGLVGTVDIPVRAEVTYEADEKFGERDCAVLAAKITVIADDAKAAGGANFGIKMKKEGGGEGRLHFSVAEGRPVKLVNNLKVKVAATAQDPNGGGEISIKATLSLLLSHELVK